MKLTPLLMILLQLCLYFNSKYLLETDPTLSLNKGRKESWTRCEI
ncbi:hypothetical protein GcC1_c17468o14 [Golovinomyces cichoracearum]|uniref:Uncharacterized protein n=1 Tax=Golovinomyces cichoracearum TaxID=62708 RepID=A0A420ITY8_9PEZI|nr:hypothetical protein GcC1_c17468o14 [Golovinomyces cichoracearum]